MPQNYSNYPSVSPTIDAQKDLKKIKELNLKKLKGKPF